jgi:hypothetical protein
VAAIPIQRRCWKCAASRTAPAAIKPLRLDLVPHVAHG